MDILELAGLARDALCLQSLRYFHGTPNHLDFMSVFADKLRRSLQDSFFPRWYHMGRSLFNEVESFTASSWTLCFFPHH